MRAFISVSMPEDIRLSIESVGNEFKMQGLTLVKKEALHLTLQFLGDIDAEQAGQVVAAMKASKREPFKVSVSGISYFTPRLIRVIFAGIAEGSESVKELYGKLGSELKARGVDFENENDYRPHITIARVKRVGDMHRLREVLAKNSRANFGSFEAKTVALRESVLTPEGPVYKSLYELKL